MRCYVNPSCKWLLFLFVILLSSSASGGDWPMWRYGPDRGAASPEQLPSELHLQWVRRMPALKPAWPSEPRLHFDTYYQPVVMGKTLYFGSSRDDTITALDTDTGAGKWRFRADAPVRLAPVAANGKIYFAADDGCLYCLAADTGKLLWKFRGAPADRKVVGNARVISPWPARGGPVLSDGTIYFAAGIWPFMGVFIHALDAETGRLLWTNRDSNSVESYIDHNYSDKVGVSPQGYMVVVGDRLIVPCGRSWPACYDRKSGKLLYYRLAQDPSVTLGKNWFGYQYRTWREGSWKVTANSRYIFNSQNLGTNFGGILDLPTGILVEMTNLTNLLPELVLTDKTIYGAYRDIRAYDNTSIRRSGGFSWEGDGLGLQVEGQPVPISRATSISSRRPTASYRTPPKNLVMKEGPYRVLMKLDLDNIQVKSTKNVFAVLKTGRVARPGEPARIAFHAMRRDWHQGASWKKPFPDQNVSWNGMKHGKDYYAQPFAVLYIPKAASGQLYAVNSGPNQVFGFATAINNWKSGKWKNCGFVMILDGGVSRISLKRPEKAPAKISKRSGPELTLPEQWTCKVKARSLIKAGSRLYAGDENVIKAIDIPPPGGKPKVSWQVKIKGVPGAMLVADGKLFAATHAKWIYCFGPNKVEPRKHWPEVKTPPASLAAGSAEAAEILKATGVTGGYCIVTNMGDGGLINELVRKSKLDVVALDPDAKKIHALRRRLDGTDLYGSRIAAFPGNLLSAGFAPYMARLIVGGKLDALDLAGDSSARRTFEILRPYGGTLCVKTTDDEHNAFAGWVAKAKLPNAEVSRVGKFSLLKRVGALTGGGEWTHEYGDSGHTLFSPDKLVKPPFGILWFGRPANLPMNMDIRAHQTPQAVAGRIIVQLPLKLFALDTYTGRLLWQIPLPDPKKIFDVYRVRADNYTTVSVKDAIYVACGETCLRLDPKTGRTVAELRLPGQGRRGEKPYWGHIIVWKDLLIAAEVFPNRFWKSGYASIRKGDLSTREIAKLMECIESLEKAGKIGRKGGESREAFYDRNLRSILESKSIPEHFPESVRAVLRKRGGMALASKDRIVVMNRYTGKVLWTREAASGFAEVPNAPRDRRTSSIVVGSGKLFCVDALPRLHLNILKRRGGKPELKPRLLALDARTGKLLWSAEKGVLGKQWVAYSADQDVVLLTSWGSTCAFRGNDGAALWTKHISSQRPFVVRGDDLTSFRVRGPASGLHFSQGINCGWKTWTIHSVSTGELKREFKSVGHFCSYPSACERLLLLRTSTAGYFDYETGDLVNLAGWRKGCKNNLIPADGVLTAIRDTGGCKCNYPIFTSMTLVHTPEAKDWARLPPSTPKAK